MPVIIHQSDLNGSVRVPSSKSAGHRVLISAALSKGTSHIRGITMSSDIEATMGALSAMGATLTIHNDEIVVEGITSPTPQCTIDCKESGSTVRFLLPVAAALGIHATFIGSGRLPQRPLFPITMVLREHGVDCSDTLPLTIEGRLQPGEYAISGDISSQFITGLLYSMCLWDKPSTLTVTTPLQSAGYVDMTVDVCRRFGCKIDKLPHGFTVCGTGTARDVTVEGDYSQAAFFLEAAALGNRIVMHGLNADSLQGDRQCLALFEQMGCAIQREGDTVTATGGTLRPMHIDASQIPDLVPALAVALAFADGVSRIDHAERLRIKECDRLDAVAQNLIKMGIAVEQTNDSITIHGGRPHGADLSGYNDHRIVMAFAVAGTKTGQMQISDAHAIQKSYPAFFDHLQSLGGDCCVF